MDLEQLSDDSLYRMLDRIYPKRAQIEQALVQREHSLFNTDQTVFFYDLTSTYFEGQALKNPKAKRGYSRDMRPDCKQVVVGLVVNRDGFPMAHEIFEGNTQDKKSLPRMLDVLDQRVGLQPGQTVVVDRGMAYAENLAEFKRRKLKYLVASRQSERDQWLAEFDHEKKLLKDLEKLAKRVETGKLKDLIKIGEAIGRLKERYPRVARYYDITCDNSSSKVCWVLDNDKYQKARALDGAYLLKTERDDLSAEDVWLLYSLLTRAENAFRCMKSPLAERPIFHQLERRVDTHIFLCVLAYHLLVAIEKTLLDQGVHTSWATVRDALASELVNKSKTM